MLHLSDTHSRFPSIGLDQLVRIIQRPAELDNYLHPCVFRLSDNTFVSFSRICIRILFEDEMRDVPGLEQLYKQRLRRFPKDQEF